MNENLLIVGFQGFITSASLIIAIGAQNAFVLKQGILKNHVFVTVTLCALLDAILIIMGILGFGTLLMSHSYLMAFAKWGGIAFLFYYGLKSFIAAFKPNHLVIDKNDNKPSLQKSIYLVLVFTLLNPHAYLDTVILLGSISTHFSVNARPYFAIGAISASFMWFYGMGYGARLLAPLFKKTITWKILDFLIGVTMWSIAISILIRL